jgi:crossover junction endodeoxyribonuclease RusA
MILAFQVFGVAEPKGSTRAFVPKGWTRPIITDSNRNLKSWQQLVAEGASLALGKLPKEDRAIVTQGVRLTIAFYLPRPKKYHKPDVNPAHLTKPDIDKLTRAVIDALTQVVFVDDSQVIELVARKDYARLNDAPHVDVRIEPAYGGQGIRVPAVDKGPVLFPLYDDQPRAEASTPKVRAIKPEMPF